MSDAESDGGSVNLDIEEAAEAALNSLLPEKSRKKYEKAYKQLTNWMEEKNVPDGISEKTLLAYFNSKMSGYAPNTKWSHFSMLRTFISKERNIDIKNYTQLIAFLKRKAVGYQPVKSRIFTKEDILRFVREADDNTYLLNKVILIFGIYAAMRRCEFSTLMTDDVQELPDNCFKVMINETKTKIIRSHVIGRGTEDDLNYVEIIKRYIKLRPDDCPNKRFFLGYRKGACIKQAVGINKFGDCPKVIAQFLKLPHDTE